MNIFEKISNQLSVQPKTVYTNGTMEAVIRNYDIVIGENKGSLKPASSTSLYLTPEKAKDLLSLLHEILDEEPTPTKAAE